MTLPPDAVRRYARQVLLAPIGGAGQERFLAGTILLHGDAPLCAVYLAAAGLGRLLVTGESPELAAHDPSFSCARAEAGAPADVTVDLGDGEAFRAAEGPRLWGAADGRRLVLGTGPRATAPPDPLTRAALQTLAAGEALRMLLGHSPRVWDFHGNTEARSRQDAK